MSEVKMKIEKEIINRIDGLDQMDNQQEVCGEVDIIKTLSLSLAEIDKLDSDVQRLNMEHEQFMDEQKSRKKDRRATILTSVLTVSVPAITYMGLHMMAMKYEDEDNVFRLSSTKSNIGKITPK